MIVLHSTDNTAGDLTQDGNKGLTKIQYDYLGHPVRVQFSDGSCTEYVYAADGRKLREKHTTAVEGLTVRMGNTLKLTPEQTMEIDSVYYAGNLIFRPQDVARNLIAYMDWIGTTTAQEDMTQPIVSSPRFLSPDFLFFTFTVTFARNSR